MGDPMEDHKVHSSRGVASYLLRLSTPRGGLDPLQTLKLTYIAHGFVLGIFGRSLVEDDVEAWQYGPVIRSVYTSLPPGSAQVTRLNLICPPANLAQDEKYIVDDVFAKYGNLSGLDLSSLTHMQGTPWDITWRRFGKNAIIPRDLIQSHYKKILAGANVGANGL